MPDPVAKPRPINRALKQAGAFEDRDEAAIVAKPCPIKRALRLAVDQIDCRPVSQSLDRSLSKIDVMASVRQKLLHQTKTEDPIGDALA